MARYAEEAVASENPVHTLLKFLPGKILEEEPVDMGPAT